MLPACGPPGNNTINQRLQEMEGRIASKFSPKVYSIVVEIIQEA